MTASRELHDPVVDIFRRKAPKVLYHYTSPAGLMGIIESHCVWASDIRYLNDVNEFSVAQKTLATVLEELRDRMSGETERRVLKLLDITRISQWFEEERYRVFVSSFTEVGDLLSQWRGYCPAGAGYSV